MKAHLLSIGILGSIASFVFGMAFYPITTYCITATIAFVFIYVCIYNYFKEN